MITLPFPMRSESFTRAGVTVYVYPQCR